VDVGYWIQWELVLIDTREYTSNSCSYEEGQMKVTKLYNFFILVTGNETEYSYGSKHFDKLVLGQVVTLAGLIRPHFVKSIDDNGRYHILPVPED
jgi:hypothetical protein